jgi:hypothetical protein
MNGMGTRKKTTDAKAALFKRLYGVKPETFDKMLKIIYCIVLQTFTDNPYSNP